MNKFIGNKAFYKATLAIAVPIMIQQFIATFVNLIDNIMIGSVGSLALTSVTVANKVYLIFNSTMFGICGAAGIFIAQYYGAQDRQKCQKVFDINIACCLVIACLFVSALLFYPRQLMEIFTHNEAVIQESLRYIRFAILTYIPYAISYSTMMALRAININRIQLKIGIITVLTNTALNYILIFGHFGLPALGIQGAAIATAIARGLEMIIYVMILIKHQYLLTISASIFHLDLSLIQSMIKKAIPLTINEILFSLGLTMIFLSYMRCDESLIAAISVEDTVMQIAYVIFGGLSSAISILIGNRLGANQIQEARDNAYRLIAFGVCIGIGISCILSFVAPVIASFYNVSDIIKETIVSLLRIKALILPIYVYNISIFFILRAGGDTLSTMLMDSVFLWCFGVLISTLLSTFFQLDLLVLFMIVESCDLLKVFLSTYFFKKGKWAKNITVTQA